MSRSPYVGLHVAAGEVRVVRAAVEELGDVHSIRGMSVLEAHLHGFRIAYAFLSEIEMRSALTILADALRTLAR